MKNYVYHFVPDNMEGTILYPLNVLKYINPGIFQVAVKKYEGREIIMDRNIPVLDCTWSDVLFFSTVYPGKIKEFMNSYNKGGKINWTFYKIPIDDLDPKNLIIYKSGILGNDKNIEGGCIENYNPNTFDNYSEMTEITKNYLIKAFAKPEPGFLLFHGAVHVLYKGNVDVSRYEVINLK